MPRTAIERRHDPVTHALAPSLDALGLDDSLFREAVEVNAKGMREAVSTRGAPDWVVRTRCAQWIAELYVKVRQSTGNTQSEPTPLVNLTLVAGDRPMAQQVTGTDGIVEGLR